MRPTEHLGKLISAHMAAPGDIAEQKPESDFVLSSLRAAIFSNLITRRKILSDVASVLGCQAKDLEFLFADLSRPTQPTQNHDVIVPDFRAELMAVAE